jgi:predicted permease
MPRLVTSLLSRIRRIRTRRADDADSRQEVESHVAELTERYVRQGMTPADAERAARRRFGNVALVREDVRTANGFRWIDSAMQDLRYARRQMRRSPGFSAVLIATLALGIGGTTAVFSLVQSVLLAPLPYEQPDRLVRIFQQAPGNPATRGIVSAAHFKALREEASSFESVAAIYLYSEQGRTLVTAGQADRLRVLPVTSGYFEVFRMHPVVGRTFDRSDETGTRRVVLSHRLWRTRFESDPSIVGGTISLDAEPYEVAGVAPEDFRDVLAGESVESARIDAWLPEDVASDNEEQNYSLVVVGRLAEGRSLDQAQAELVSIGLGMKARWPKARLSDLVVLSLKDTFVEHTRALLLLLLAAVGLVLLVACVNAAGLVLVRSTGRAQELAIRAALGSGRGRIVRQLVVENGSVAVLGGLAGLALAAATTPVLKTLGADTLPRIGAAGLDPAVLGFGALVTMGSLVGFGVLPAIRFARVAPADALRQHTRSTTGSRGERFVRHGLASAQIALALTLLTGAGVLVATVQRLAVVSLGFDAEHRLTFEVNLPTARYDAARRAIFQEDLSRVLATIPGVRAAGGISRLPATGAYHPWNAVIETGPRSGLSISQATGFNIQQRTISGDLFGALDIPILAGRTFDDRDSADAPPRLVVSANFARQAFPDMPLEAVVGQRVRTIGGRYDIVGVVGDVAMNVYGVATLAVYHAHRQFAVNRNWALVEVVSATVPPGDLVNAVRRKVAALDPELVVHKAAPLADVVERGASRERFAVVLMGAFAAVSLALAALGLYGALAYSVRQRTPEIGIRMALGATPGEVIGLVLRQAGVVVAVGVAAGIAGALLLGRSLQPIAFHVHPADPLVMASTTAVLVGVAGIAAWLPARRASRVAPKIAMNAGE